MAKKVVFEIDDEDFVPREGVAVLSGWTKGGEPALRLASLEDTPVWSQQGLLQVGLDRARQTMSRIWQGNS